MKEIVLIKVGEIVLKGLNRKNFESMLIKNMKNGEEIEIELNADLISEKIIELEEDL